MNLGETETYEPGIYQLEITDPVIGGPDGIDNLQAKQLANRTNWLKAKIDSLLGLSVIHTATLKATPSDADEFGFLSSTAAWSLVKMTGTNLKAWLKAYFDTVYAVLNSPTFTGTPTAPTAAAGTNTTQVATTAFSYGLLSALSNGYIKLSNGLILQWGSVSVPFGTTLVVTLPVAYPTAILNAQVSHHAALNVAPGITWSTLTSVSIQNADGGTATFRWFTIGN